MKLNIFFCIILCFLCGLSKCDTDVNYTGLREPGDELVYTSFKEISSVQRQNLTIDFVFRDNYNIIRLITQGLYTCERDADVNEFVWLERGDNYISTRITAFDATYMHCTESLFGFYNNPVPRT